jgi:hypothetical protein
MRPFKTNLFMLRMAGMYEIGQFSFFRRNMVETKCTRVELATTHLLMVPCYNGTDTNTPESPDKYIHRFSIFLPR